MRYYPRIRLCVNIIAGLRRRQQGCADADIGRGFKETLRLAKIAY
jgi:hypothetical protein